MLRDKIAIRILLILFVVHVAAAAPTIIRQRSLEVTKKVTPALEKRTNLDDESSHLFPRIDNPPSTPGAPPSQDDTLPGSGTVQSQDETSPTPGDPQLHSGPVPELGTSQLHIDQPPTSGSPQLHIDHPPTPGTPQLQHDLPPTPGAPPSQDDPLLASGTPFLHNDQPSTPGASPSQDDTLPGSGTLQSQDETSPTPGDPQLHSGPVPELGTSQLHIDQPPTSGTPQLQDDLPPTPGALPSEDDMTESSVSGLSQLHNVQLPPGALWSEDVTSSTGVPQLHEDPWPHWADNFWRDEGSGSPPSPDGPHPVWAYFGGLSNEGSPGTSSTTSGAPQLQNDPPPASGTPQLQDHLPPTPGALPSEDDMSESSVSGLSQLHTVQLPPGALWSEDVTSSTGVPQLHDDPWPHWAENFWRDEGSGSPPSPVDPHPAWAYFRGLWNEGSGSPPLPDGPHPAWAYFGGLSNEGSGAPQLQNDPPPASGTPQLHRVEPDDFDTSYRWVNDLPVTEWRHSSSDFDSETPPPLHLETPPPSNLETPPPLNSEIPPPLHLETPSPLDSETPPPMHLETPPPMHLDAPLPLDSEIPPPLDSQTPPPLHLDAPPPLHSETLQLLESEALPSAPETPTFFNDALRQKLKEYAIVSAVSSGASVGLVLGLEKLINHHSHASQPAGRDLASSGVVGRGANMHPRPPKNPVSRAPAKLRDEDLRLLSILTRRALERLD